MPTFPRALLPALLASLALQACRLSPEGSCETDGDCRGGRHCAENVCVPDGRSDLYAGCVVDRDCDPFAQCSRGVCVLLPGRCAVPVDCAAWESCDESVCRPLPGRCGTLEDCAPWEICIAAASTSPPLPERRCAVAPGRCTDASHCAAWQVCSATRFCETGPGFCAGDAGCDAWKTCGADHLCALRPGACDTQDDCAPELVCEVNACLAQPPPPALDPAAVHLVGTLAPGTPGRAALAPLPLATPHEKLVGLADGDLACGARLAPDGSVLLTRASAPWTLVPDPMVWDPAIGLWSYPADPAANDAAVALPAGCTGAVSVSVVLQAETGAPLFGCDGAWFDASSAAVGGGRPLLAWSAGGRMLSGTADMVTPPVLLDAAGLEIPLSGETMADGDRLVAWRADGDGFRVIRALGATGFFDLEAWTIDGLGVTARGPALPAPPSAAVDVSGPLLDAYGAVHQLGVTAAGDGLVVKRTPGGAAEVSYDEATLPASTSLLDAPVAVDAASCLVTGP